MVPTGHRQAQLIDGDGYALRLRQRITSQVRVLQNRFGIQPGLAVVLVGEDPASQSYVRSKIKHASQVHITSFEHRLGSNTTQAQLLDLVRALNADPNVHGILVQLPLPPQIESETVIQSINPAKDVDGFQYISAGRLFSGRPHFVPCTALGCLLLLRHATKGKTSGKHAIVIGRSNIVGKPTAMLLLMENCTVTIAHSRTQDLQSKCREADFVVAAVGKPELIRGDWLKPDSVVIDVGINRIQRDGRVKLVGDVAFEEARNVARAITPVPGGVGPMTVACLLANTVKAACDHQRVKVPTGRRRKGIIQDASRSLEYHVLEN